MYALLNYDIDTDRAAGWRRPDDREQLVEEVPKTETVHYPPKSGQTQFQPFSDSEKADRGFGVDEYFCASDSCVDFPPTLLDVWTSQYIMHQDRDKYQGVVEG